MQRDAGEVGDCFCSGFDCLILLNVLVAGNPDRGDGHFDGREGVKDDVDAVDDWVCRMCVADGYE